MGLWFRDGIYKACSTWQVRLPPPNSPNRHLGWRCRGTRHYRYDIYTGNAVNAFSGFLIEKYCVDSALKWQSIVFFPPVLRFLVHSFILRNSVDVAARHLREYLPMIISYALDVICNIIELIGNYMYQVEYFTCHAFARETSKIVQTTLFLQLIDYVPSSSPSFDPIN